MKEDNRLYFLDIARGIAIILVVLGHIYKAGVLKVVLTSFHVPLFFIISGCLIKYKNKNNIDFISRAKTLLIPYFIFCIINIFVLLVLGNFDFGILKWNLFLTLSMYGIGALWFLPALFISESIFMFIKCKVKNVRSRILIIVILSIIPFIKINIENTFINTIKIVLLRSLVALLFITLGYIIFNYIQKHNISNIKLIFLMIIVMMLSIYNGQVDLYALSYNNVFLYLFNSLALSFITIMMIKNVKINKSLIYCGTNSLIIMATHQNIMMIIQRKLNNQFDSYFGGTLFFIIIMLLEIPLIYIINRYLPYMLGKFKNKSKLQKEILN